MARNGGYWGDHGFEVDLGQGIDRGGHGAYRRHGMARIIRHDFTPGVGPGQLPVPEVDAAGTGKVRWQGVIKAIQPRAWVWRYKTDNRTHHLTGFNLWLDGQIAGEAQKFAVAISGLQEKKVGFRHGDTASGTGWPVQGKKREVVELYRAGKLKILDRPDRNADRGGPPFIDLIPDLEVYDCRGCRMLDAKLWRTVCMTCLWANKSRVEIEYDFEHPKSKRYRSETFCYGPRSCPQYAMGEPRPVPYKDDAHPSMDDGWMDDICIEGRENDD
jgi:hypothetical protein